MKLYDILKQGHDSEILLKEAFVKTAEYHKTKPEIYYECQAFASLSDEHARFFRKTMGRYLKSGNESGETHKFERLIPEHQTWNDLADDLHYLWLLTREVEFFVSLLLQGSMAINDYYLEKSCGFFTEENSKQAQWLIERINREVLQLLPIAG